LENINHGESKMTEDYFDVCFSYFPITFKPPAEDPHGITQQGLKNALLGCLTATPLFAEYAIPSLLEKLATQSATTKRDATITLGQVAPIYGMESLTPHVDTIWELLKEDVEKAQDLSEEQGIALECISSLATTLSTGTGTSAGKNPLDRFIEPIVKDCMDHLREAESKLARPAGRMLAAVAASGDAACCFVAGSALPMLLKQVAGDDASPTSMHKRRVLLDVIKDIVAASSQVYTTTDLQSPISQHRDALLELYTSAASAQDEAMRMTGMRGLAQLLPSKGVLQDQDKTLVVQVLNNGLMDSEQDVAKCALDQLLTVDASLLKSLTIPHLIHILSTLETESGDEEFRLVQVDWILQCLETLSTSELATDAVREELQILTTKLGGLHTGVSDFDLEYCASLIASLTVLSRISKESDLWSLLVIPILQDALQSTDSQGSLYENVPYLHLVANLIGNIVQRLNGEEQVKALNQTITVFAQGKTGELGFNINFSPLEPSSPLQQTHLSCLFSAVLCHVAKDVLGEYDVEAWLKNAASTTDAILSQSLSQAAATVVNKSFSGEKTKMLVEKMASEISLDSPSSLTMWAWLGRATVLTCHSSAFMIVGKIIDAYSTNVGMKAAESMEILIGDDDACLGKGNANVKLLYKQKLLQSTLPLLTRGFAESKGETKHCHLVALSILLAHVPKTLLLNHAKQILPLLLESLHVTDAKLKLSTLALLGTLIREVPAMMGQHVDTLVRELLQLCKADHISDPVCI
jgi:DNA repair/transcription protein MET18/MMS19